MTRPADRTIGLYLATVSTGGLTAVFLGGLLYIAIDRDINHEYIPWSQSRWLVRSRE